MKKLLLTLLMPAALWAGSAVPLDLATMTDQAGKIFFGVCLETEASLDEHRFPSLSVRFYVLEGVKGVSSGDRVLVKQYGTSGSLSCRPGEELLLFLYPESELGFTSAIGLGQGRFALVGDETGFRKVRSPFPHLQREVGEAELSRLLGKIRMRVNDAP